MTQPSSVAILAHSPLSALPEPSRLRRWERLWTRGLISAPPDDVMFSVIALIQVSREESWGRKLPKPSRHWETPQRHIAGNERRAAVLRTRAILNWEQFLRLRTETRARAQEWLELDDPAAEFKAADFLMVPTLAARALHLYYSGDPAGAYYDDEEDAYGIGDEGVTDAVPVIQLGHPVLAGPIIPTPEPVTQVDNLMIDIVESTEPGGKTFYTVYIRKNGQIAERYTCYCRINEVDFEEALQIARERHAKHAAGDVE